MNKRYIIYSCIFRGVDVLQATEAELKYQVDRLTDQCARLEASLHEANSETEKLRVKLLEHQSVKFASDVDQPLPQNLQQRIATNKAYICFLFINCCNPLSVLSCFVGTVLCRRLSC